MTSRGPKVWFYIVAILALGVDQFTKEWASASLAPLRSISLVPGFLNLTYVRNPGIAFGMFPGQGLIIAVIMIMIGLGTVFYARSLDWARWEPNLIGAALVGGALGNLLDRARQGYVVDFFDVHIGPHHWPVFNVADSLICLAVAWIVLRQLLPSPVTRSSQS